jgi:lipid II:glycine glycyltransferase (peptidoglycan interpeptide bridge formation enzyme)
LEALRGLARERGAVFIKIDPDVRLGTSIPGAAEAARDETGEAVAADLLALGWRFSQEQVQFRNTVQVDLAAPPAALLGRMKQKTRYNIRLAQRKGVRVRPVSAEDLDLLYQMYVETSLRDGFVIRERAYYLTLWQTFLEAGMLDPLIAEVAGEPVAAIVVFRFAGQAWYMQGMSRQSHREKMPNHLLQWEAISRARDAGCRIYDLWGAPDNFYSDDPLWGVFRFKEGLGGRVIRHIGAWDLPIRPVAYRLYMDILPRWLEVLRRRRRTEIRQEMRL